MHLLANQEILAADFMKQSRNFGIGTFLRGIFGVDRVDRTHNALGKGGGKDDGKNDDCHVDERKRGQHIEKYIYGLFKDLM